MLRSVFAFTVLLIVTPTIALAYIAYSLVSCRELDATVGYRWSKIMLWAMGADVSYHGTEHAHRHHPCILMANHQSNVDIWAIFPVLPKHTKFVAKRSLFRIPIFGTGLRRAGFISIDRTDRKRAIESLRLAAERIRNGRSVLLFPEGTRTRDGKLQPLKKGPFHLAMAAGVPVVPVAIQGSFRVLPPKSLRVTPGPVRVEFLPPIDTTPFQPDDRDGLRELVHRRLGEAL